MKAGIHLSLIYDGHNIHAHYCTLCPVLQLGNKKSCLEHVTARPGYERPNVKYAVVNILKHICMSV